MTKEKQQALATVLQNAINETDRLFKTKEQSHAYIIGYLQGALKITISELKNMADVHPPLNIAGYQLSKHMCWTCSYTPTIIGTHSKYNYKPQQNMFLSKYMKGDTATIFIQVVYNSDEGTRDTKEIQLKVVFD